MSENFKANFIPEKENLPKAFSFSKESQDNIYGRTWINSSSSGGNSYANWVGVE